MDEQLYGTEIEGTPDFKLAQMVILSKCISCHGAWANYTQEDYEDSGLVVIGSAQDSVLYTRIRGNDANVAGDMPSNGSNLTSDELLKIKTWINQ